MVHKIQEKFHQNQRLRLKILLKLICINLAQKRFKRRYNFANSFAQILMTFEMQSESICFIVCGIHENPFKIILFVLSKSNRVLHLHLRRGRFWEYMACSPLTSPTRKFKQRGFTVNCTEKPTILKSELGLGKLFLF